jgi:hypothetical protein
VLGSSFRFRAKQQPLVVDFFDCYEPAACCVLQTPDGGISKHSYAKIFKDTIWEAALDGCRGKAPISGSSSSSSSHVCYDAVLTVGGPTAAQLTLNFLRQAEKMQKAQLPVVVQYMVSVLVCRCFVTSCRSTSPLCKRSEHVCASSG